LINALAFYPKSKYFVVYQNTHLSIEKFIGCFVIISGFTKSAQFIFCAWLVDAMEGPIPVSALIHSATMVAAGVLLLFKYLGYINQSSETKSSISNMGFTTGTMNSFHGLCLLDSKSLLASSTCDQIGLMFLLCGIGEAVLAFIQFVAHSLYKSLLFLSTGVLIHQSGEQESRGLTVMKNHSPITVACYQIGMVSLVGLPGSVSHYSKALLLNLTFKTVSGVSSCIWYMNQLSQLITSCSAFLGVNGIYSVLGMVPRRKGLLLNKPVKVVSFIKIPLILLASFTI
jgi:NADH-quinone oxidoreductase subunit L